MEEQAAPDCSFAAIVLAAGHGKRMKSDLCKVLHPIAGHPLVYYPVRAAVAAGAEEVAVVASPATKEPIRGYLEAQFPDQRIVVTVQEVARGTGDAVRFGLDVLSTSIPLVVVLCADTPLLRSDDIQPLLDEVGHGGDLAFATCVLDDPAGYGRILRNAAGDVTAIREDADLSPEQRGIGEINAGLYAGGKAALAKAVAGLDDSNAQGEFYLTDIVELIASGGGKVAGVKGGQDVMLGVNHRGQLSAAEETMYRRIADAHRAAGVTVRGDARIDDGVGIEADATIEAGVRLRGTTQIGAGTVVDVGCVITDTSVGRDVLLKPYSVATESVVEDGAQIGPFAHLRPASRIGPAAHIGNFVETKKTHVRAGAKANHLAYLGDGDVGEKANIGAGTIFCNYDGFVKSQTVIGPGAFIGSDSQLVAPVTIGEGSYVATGTCVTKDVPADALAVGRVAQENKLGYATRLRARLAARKKT
jgi:bifunctional UDP-N-acetylglucosamine pyrophosphorylase / glucosamine-1-phosphate N-acetyltransferase